MARFLILIFSFALFVTCSKKDKTVLNLVVPIAPRILFASVTPASVKEYADSITFEIAYRDEQGDLGEDNPNAYNLFLIDNRIGITYPFRIPQLAPDNANVPIQGLFDLVLPNTGITDGSTSQKATFGIYVKDRMGNVSDTVQTSEITVNK